MAEASVRSPCISVCVLDSNDICEGCYRSGEEISNWGLLNDEERMKVIELTAQRFRASQKNTLL